MEFYPPIPPCSSRKVIFYICSEKMAECEHDDYVVEVSVNGQNPTCKKNMTWHFDFITNQQQYKIDIDLNDKINDNNILIPRNSKYELIDIYQNLILSGIINSYSQIKQLKENNYIKKGLYILIIKSNNIIIFKEKFIKGY
jgi:hypothetical protein